MRYLENWESGFIQSDLKEIMCTKLNDWMIWRKDFCFGHTCRYEVSALNMALYELELIIPRNCETGESPEIWMIWEFFSVAWELLRIL